MALTRARKQVTLTSAQTRYRFGSLQFCEDSRFLEEIPDKYLNITKKASSGKGTFARPNDNEWSFRRYETPKPRTYYASGTTSASKPTVKTKSDVQMDMVGDPASIDQIRPGVRVYHFKFGFGNVQSVEGLAPDTKAVVNFDTVGTKTLLLKFAKLLIPK